MSDPRLPSASSDGRWAAAAVAGRRIGHAIEFHRELGSTSDRAREALSEPGGDGLAVVADRQSAGRGRLGRRWLSPAGANLLVSVGLRLDLPVARAWWLAAAVALAVRRGTAAWADLGIRWPNDLVADDGLKVAGLLVETQVEGERLVGAVVGIGINANWRRTDMPPEIALGATSLADLVGAGVDRVDLLAASLAALHLEVRQVESGVSPVERFRAASWLTGRAVEVETPAGLLSGIAGPVGEDGGLSLEGSTVHTTVTVGEVIRVRSASGMAGA